MQIKMDTDAVRSMSSRFRQTADSMDASLASIKATVEAAGWQSQAREEFIMRLEMLRRTSTQSATVLRMMAQAADQKAEQWEAIANVFNGPFHSMGNIWSSVIAFLSGIGGGIWNAITNIQLPSLPRLVFPSISGAAVIGGIASIIPKWEWNPPDWWPFNKNKETASGSGGGSWGEKKESSSQGNRGENPTKTIENTSDSSTQDKFTPVEPIGLDQDDPRWGRETMGKNGNTIDESGCLITSVAMIARHNGADVTPSDVNSYMQTHGGYVDGTSNMYWGSAEKYLESTLGIDMSYKGVSSSDVASVVSSGDPVIIHVKGSSSDGHWVVATSVDPNGNFVVYESGTGKQSTYRPNQLLSGHKAFIK